MLRIAAPVSRKARSTEGIATLNAVLALIEATRATASTIDAPDALTKRELFDSLAVAELSVLRLLDDED